MQLSPGNYTYDKKLNLDILARAYISGASKTPKIPARASAPGLAAAPEQAANPGLPAALAPYFQYQSQGWIEEGQYHSKFTCLLDYNERLAYMLTNLDAIGVIPGIGNNPIPYLTEVDKLNYSERHNLTTLNINSTEKAIYDLVAGELLGKAERVVIGAESFLLITVENTFVPVPDSV